MGFNFESLNFERKFDFDVTNIRGKYADCKEMFEKYGEGKTFKVNAIYISTASKFDPEKPMLALDDTYLNLPVHLLGECKKILDDKSACDQINNGEIGVSFYQYFKKLRKELPDGTEKSVKRKCYSIKWVKIANDTWDEDDDDIFDDDEE